MKLICRIMILLSVLLWECIGTKRPSLNQVNLLEELSTGVSTFSVNGKGNSYKEIEANALDALFKSVLFDGVISSSQQFSNALIPNKELMGTSPILKSFFEEQAYRQYVTSIQRTERSKRTTEGDRSIPFVITINKISLRKYLERNNLVREFGY